MSPCRRDGHRTSCDEALAFRKILGTGARVLPAGIEHLCRDIAASILPPLCVDYFAVTEEPD
jgi:hypothetical protein